MDRGIEITSIDSYAEESDYGFLTTEKCVLQLDRFLGIEIVK